ncbi:hypothetical protein [Actinoplanes sp. NPDC089786]|uniref:hypothetical protein n=1 Tax=Actinoplanes sp. NPDC089786 TaxID=3155185 RepID=UPI0034178424
MTLDRSVSDQPKGKVMVGTALFAQTLHCLQRLPFLVIGRCGNQLANDVRLSPMSGTVGTSERTTSLRARHTAEERT